MNEPPPRPARNAGAFRPFGPNPGAAPSLRAGDCRLAPLRRRTVCAGAAAVSLGACGRRAEGVSFRTQFDTAVLPERDWLIVGGEKGSVRVANRAAVIDAEAGSPLAVAARFLATASDSPLGSRESLSWRARVIPRGAFFVIADAAFGPAPLLLEQAPYGFHLTARDRSGEVRGVEIAADEATRRDEQAWRLDRESSALRLSLNGRLVFDAVVPVPMSQLAFGETRSDAQHGGQLVLRDVRYERYPLAPEAR